MPEPDETNEAPGAAAAEPEPGEPGIRPLIAELRQLVVELTTLVRSELAFQTTRAKVLGGGVRAMALYGVFALFFVFFALGGLTVGLLLALTPLVTAWGATAIVVGVLLVGAGVCVFALLGSLRRMKRLLKGEPQP